MRRAIILLFGAMLASTMLRAPEASSTVDVEGLVTATASFLEELNHYEELSLALMITKDGVPVLEKAYGLANRIPDYPNEEVKNNVTVYQLLTHTAAGETYYSEAADMIRLYHSSG